MANFVGLLKPRVKSVSMTDFVGVLGRGTAGVSVCKFMVQDSLAAMSSLPLQHPSDVLHWVTPEDIAQNSPSVFAALKEKIIITPQTIDAGLVLAAKQYTAVVWSTYAYWQRMISWAATNLDGVDVTNADGQPVWYGPNKARVYDVQINAQGQASVVGSICWTFQGIPAPCINVTGTRLIVWCFEPDWSEKPIETLEWLTDVLQAYNHEEQRIRLRQNPRRAMKYSFLMNGAQKIGLMHNDLYGWMHRVFAVPIWTDWQYLGADYDAGTSLINISTSNLDINAGQLLMIWTSATSNEIVEVQSMTSNSVTLTKPTNSAWGKMSRLVPCRLGRISKTVSVSYKTGVALMAGATFAFEPKTGVGSNRIGTSPYTTMVSGLPVLTVAPEHDTDMALEKDLLTVDAEKGGWYVYSKGDIPGFVTTLRWVLSGRPAISNFLAWLGYCKGRLVPFWMPSWQRELEIAQIINATDTSISVKRSDLTRFIGPNVNGRKYICFINQDRSFTIKTMTSVGEAGDNETIGINTSFGSVKNNDSFRCISFLRYVRLDTDKIELTWHNGSLLECSIPVKEIPAP